MGNLFFHSVFEIKPSWRQKGKVLMLNDEENEGDRIQTLPRNHKKASQLQ